MFFADRLTVKVQDSGSRTVNVLPPAPRPLQPQAQTAPLPTPTLPYRPY
jgi:hypothetical protein